ncbi:hypothetical protein [Tissierella sp. Yu-01]|uniref:hypothetical protein n=1 Tax=Tissierella sp. Yu-01 TaxID=3035694 RepID=UPI00240D025A|nr:hypothetical protein [Tissierella sp. Yu-01]WFA08283.1 hypothetical protein P3962_11150 [Tissierella sp. Yu-01]
MADNVQDNNEISQQDFIEVNPLLPTGPAEQLFVAGASVFEITVFTPPVQRVTILAVNLPDPDTFGPFDSYIATLLSPGSDEPLETLFLQPTADSQNWVASTLLSFGGTLPNINVEVRPVGFERVGEVILEGPVFP